MEMNKNVKIRKNAWVITDLCGYGNCSLGISIPVLSLMGFDACPIPTGLFSAHTGFKNIVCLDTSTIFKEYLESMIAINNEVLGTYIGYICADNQITEIIDKLSEINSGLILLDPILGDNGSFYSKIPKERVDDYLKILPKADIITPNITEACKLTGTAYSGASLNEEDTREICLKLKNLGAKTVVLKGIKRDENKIVNAVMDRDGKYFELASKYIEMDICGTGDLFASLLFAFMLKGKELAEAVKMTGELVSIAVDNSKDKPEAIEYGVEFNTVLNLLLNGNYI